MDNEREGAVIEFWKQHAVYGKAKERLQGKKKFYFLDGPPYATGAIHIGTAWNKILKDVYIRFWRMQGFDVWDQPGYDTHGIPVENKVEKEMQLRAKHDIERLGIEKFIIACRKFATQHIDAMNAQFANLGVWMDWEHPYLTLNNEYIEGAWHTFKVGYEKGLLYHSSYSVHVCPHCVDPDSIILVEGGTRKIKELKHCWEHNKVLAVDTESKTIEITKPLGYMDHEEDAFFVKTAGGRQLIASSDHPFWTKRGWVPLSMLQLNEQVAVYHHTESRLPPIAKKGRVVLRARDVQSVLDSLEITASMSLFHANSSSKIKIKRRVHELRKKGCSYSAILKCIRAETGVKISKSWVSKTLNAAAGTRYDFLVAELEEKGLLTLHSNDTKAFITARLLGHMYGDGSLSVKRSKNRNFPVFNITFTGKEEDLKSIQKDLDTLSYSYSSISKTVTESVINGRTVRGVTTSMRCYASSLAVLLIALGVPVGRKTGIPIVVPKWIESSKKLTREFLAAYFGSELDIIKPRKYGKGFSPLRLHLTKDRKLEQNGLDFGKKICDLVSRFGITSSDVSVERTIVNGKEKSKITISIDCNDANIITFAQFMGYQYCKAREVRAAQALGYLRYKKKVGDRYANLKKKILSLRRANIACSKIAAMLGIPELYVRHVVYGKSKSSRAAIYIPPFDEWLQQAVEGLGDGLVWDEVESIQHAGKRKVCDLAVETHHNFITNGFLTHNCETAVAYNEIEYSKRTDPSVFVKFPVLGKKNEFLVIWTTTPWTLPSNTGIMVHPDATYVKAKVNDQVLVVAKDLLPAFMEKIGAPYDVLEEVQGGTLIGIGYTNPLADLFPFIRTLKDAHRVVPSKQYVSLTEGTGLVHTAPGHGKEDYLVGLENKLPAINPLRMNGTYGPDAGEFAGMFAKQADRKIIDVLKERGFLLLEEKITHDYPECWRCDSPLLQMAVPQWFFKVTAIRDKLLRENDKVKWHPDWARQRFRNWLENLGDWPISRQRYWGIPLPIWRCECGEVKVIGSRDELPYAPTDLHRPYIDAVTLPCACGKTMKRIPDVLDVWFDSGLAAWASLGYPKNKAQFDELFPSDFQTEGPDQFRGWWNSEIITSVITFGKAPFRNILLHGFVLDAHGDKMSKSRGNIVQPEDVIAKYGRDVLRLYLVSSPPWEDFYFKWVDAEATAKSFLVIENTFNFVKSYVPEPVRKPERLNAEDKWILSRLNSLITLYTNECKAYNAHKAAAALHDFLLNDFSRFYIKLVRDRVWPSYSGRDKDAALYTLHEVALESSKMLAPFCPFLAERVYQDVLRPLGAKEESVHLEKVPKADERFIDKELEAQVDLAKSIVEAANALRHEQQRKLRWPLRKMVVTEEVIEEVKHLIMALCNVKEIERGSQPQWPSKSFGPGTLYLDVTMTGELKTEALLREVVRKAQDMRKKAGLVVKDRISLTLENCDELKKFTEQVSKEVGAEVITFGKADGEPLAFDDRTIRVSIAKLSA